MRKGARERAKLYCDNAMIIDVLRKENGWKKKSVRTLARPLYNPEQQVF